ncbi:hypothetical protein ACFQV8_37250 [Pseudonocardia benzenivorans]
MTEWHVRVARHHLGPGPYLDHLCTDGRRLRLLAGGPGKRVRRRRHRCAAGPRGGTGLPRRRRPRRPPRRRLPRGRRRRGPRRTRRRGVLAAIDLWKRVLRPGGRVLVQAPDAGGRGPVLRGVERAPGDRDRGRWAELLESGGLTILRQGSDGLSRPPYGRVPAWLDVRLLSTSSQLSAGRLVLGPGSGEAAVFVAEVPG